MRKSSLGLAVVLALTTSTNLRAGYTCTRFVDDEIQDAALGTSFERFDGTKSRLDSEDLGGLYGKMWRTWHEWNSHGVGPGPVPSEAFMSSPEGKALKKRMTDLESRFKSLPGGLQPVLEMFAQEKLQPQFDEVTRIGNPHWPMFVFTKDGKVRAFVSHLGTGEERLIKVGLLTEDCRLKAYYYQSPKAYSWGSRLWVINARTCEPGSSFNDKSKIVTKICNRYRASFDPQYISRTYGVTAYSGPHGIVTPTGPNGIFPVETPAEELGPVSPAR